MSVPIGAGVSIGPHADEPRELADLMTSAAEAASEEILVAERAAWLIDVLDGAGVALGAGDREAVRSITELRPSVTQVVAGWVARSARPLHALQQREGPTSDARRRSPSERTGF